MQKRWAFKKFWASVYWRKTFYYLYISKRYLPAYSCEQIVEVTSL